ncbi:MAG: peptidoglycan bridge formation glycyltransferase FemA/FemB family protein [Oscillochloridaceae bacterium]|nr:peptidoglycan bridge formation glycyltransferase FemA/FemB family protein [Chloroflexaceae bacterium]MDW8388747.1 peptidoglycan bridge formation glycyltransferase FemA/FemB family protein [Oscillochloridaceae bacterium]
MSQPTIDSMLVRSERTAPLALGEPDPTTWNAFVDAHPQGSLLQHGAWGELKTGSGWRARRIAVLGADGDPIAGALLLIRARYGLSVAYTPRGPLFSGDPVVDRLLLDGLERVARRARAVLLRLEPNLLEDDPAADALHTWLLLQGLQPVQTIQPRSSIHIDLRPSEERLLTACSKGHRADIRRAERHGVVVRSGDVTDLPVFFVLMQGTGKRAQFGVHSEAYYRAAWRLFQPRSCLLIAEVEGQAAAAHLIFADARAGRYLYSGANEVGLRSGANHLLTWHAMRWARAQGCTCYDLWGIPDALGRAATAPDAESRAALENAARRDPLIGVYRFKKGFGGKIVRYLPAYDQVLLAPLYPLALRRIGA